jgi:hypothetical protein
VGDSVVSQMQIRGVAEAVKTALAFALDLMETERQKVDRGVLAFLKSQACIRQISR